MLKMDTAERIRQRMALLGLKSVDITRATGISSGGASQWVNGLTQPSGQRLLSLARALKCTPEWLLTGRGDVVDAEPAKVEVPVLSNIEAIAYLDERSVPETYKTIPEAVPGTSHVAFGLREESEQFEPAIQSGAIYYVTPLYAAMIPRLGNKLVAARFNSHIVVGRMKPMAMGKKVFILLDGSKLDLEEPNKQLIGLVTHIINP